MSSSNSPSYICPKCGFPSPSEVECPQCGIVFSKYQGGLIRTSEEPVSLVDKVIRERRKVEAKKDFGAFENFKLNAWALPAAFGGAAIFQEIWFLKALTYFTAIIPLHEMGHAVAAWIGGRFAFPAGALIPSAAMTMIGAERNPLVTAFLLGGLFFLLYKSLMEELYFWAALSVGFIAGTVYLTFGVTNIELSSWISYGGIAGEFILSTILVIGFFQPHLRAIRWDFFRFLFLPMGSFALYNACATWLKIQAKLESIPFGTAISSDGTADAGGDMNKLISAGWTEEQIISRYLTLGRICVALILAQYVYSLWKSWGKKNAEQ